MNDPILEKLESEEPKDMRKLRYLLARVFADHRLYMDEGEYSDPDSGIDFRRDSVEDIERKMFEYYMKNCI